MSLATEPSSRTGATNSESPSKYSEKDNLIQLVKQSKWEMIPLQDIYSPLGNIKKRKMSKPVLSEYLKTDSIPNKQKL
jgi:hypothetical protein